MAAKPVSHNQKPEMTSYQNHFPSSTVDAIVHAPTSARMPLPNRTTAFLVAITSGGIAFAQLEPEAPAVGKEKAALAKVPKKTAPSQQELAELTRSLNSDDFKTRESTQIVLAKLASDFPEVTIDRMIENYIDEATVPEMRYRLRTILYNSRKSLFMDDPPGFVGIVMLPVGSFVQVRDVVPESAAARDGLLVGDRIMSIDGKLFSPDTDPSMEFSNYVLSKKAGEKVILKIMRNNEQKELPITLGARPEELMDSRFEARFDAQFKLWLDEQTERLKAKQ